MGRYVQYNTFEGYKIEHWIWIPINRGNYLVVDLISWCRENAKGNFSFDYSTSVGEASAIFQDEDDALKFKLTWC